MDFPNPSTPDSTSRNLAAGSILVLVKENNRYHIPVFGVSALRHGIDNYLRSFVSTLGILLQRFERRLGIIGHGHSVMDEPFVSKAVENYFAAINPYFAREVRKRMVKSTAIEQGYVFERFMMKVFSETFNERPLSNWPHQPPIADMCSGIVGKVEIVGWREPGLEQGATHAMMSMEEFMDAHVNHGSAHSNMPVAPFFFPKSKPSGPDLMFFIRIDDTRVIPIFVQMKLHQGSSNFSERDWNDALSTVSAAKSEGHANNFRKY
ncbi:hypothetical protein EDD11_001099 [Mortierella claussenii]|nr:hypothetical protein EDD11_001099 [Mortierella claussenii]